MIVCFISLILSLKASTLSPWDSGSGSHYKKPMARMPFMDQDRASTVYADADMGTRKADLHNFSSATDPHPGQERQGQAVPSLSSSLLSPSVSRCYIFLFQHQGGFMWRSHCWLGSIHDCHPLAWCWFKSLFYICFMHSTSGLLLLMVSWCKACFQNSLEGKWLNSYPTWVRLHSISAD